MLTWHIASSNWSTLNGKICLKDKGTERNVRLHSSKALKPKNPPKGVRYLAFSYQILIPHYIIPRTPIVILLFLISLLGFHFFSSPAAHSQVFSFNLCRFQLSSSLIMENENLRFSYSIPVWKNLHKLSCFVWNFVLVFKLSLKIFVLILMIFIMILFLLSWIELFSLLYLNRLSLSKLSSQFIQILCTMYRFFLYSCFCIRCRTHL